MNKNTVKKLAENPYYSMNDKELDALADLLQEEAEKELQQEHPQIKKINKNRVKKTIIGLEKTPVLEEDEDVPTR